jgi:hypothetical protein
MFRTDDVFDLMLRPAMENPQVTAIRFVAKESEKPLWEQHILPKLKHCPNWQKVEEPRWCQLPETVSFILADMNQDGRTEALLSFWGEPFMARTTAQQVPRYIFRVQSHSDLVARLVELERQHRILG